MHPRRAIASSLVSGLGNKPIFVASRTKASIASQLKPTVPAPDNDRSSHSGMRCAIGVDVDGVQQHVGVNDVHER